MSGYRPSAEQASDLQGVTGAVRSYADGASEAEKAKKSGQQKWGLFETNYQRSQGKTLDQSLQEIDDFSRHGVISGSASMESGHGGPGSAPKSSPAGGHSGSSGSGGFGSKPSSSPAGGSGGFGGSGSSGFGGSSTGPGAAAFGPGGSAGASFLAQHTAQQQKKFIPESKGGIGKPVP